MSEVRVNNLSNENQSGGPTISGITTHSDRHYIVPPRGTTAERPSGSPIGALRFNTDSSHLEYYRGDTIGWVEIEAELTEPLGGGTGSNIGLGTRMLMAGGRVSAPNFSDIIEFITISTLGNAQDFGDLTRSCGNNNCQNGCSSRTRGVWMGSQTQSPVVYDNTIDFVTFASQGNASNFGDIHDRLIGTGALSNQIRGLSFAGSNPSGTNKVQIDAITISTESNAFDFGDLAYYRNNTANCSSTTRGILAGGTVSPTRTNIIEYVEIMTQGNTIEFGDLAAIGDGSGSGGYNAIGLSNATRAVIYGGRDQNNNHKNVIQYITMATTGNSIEFGEIGSAGNPSAHAMGGTSPIRGVVGGGFISPATTNIMSFITITTTGNAQDFGDCTARDETLGGCSNGHGGL